MRLEPHRLVFIDETSTNTKMTRLRGRARRGDRLHASAPFGHWQTQTFIAGLRCWGLTAPWVIDGPMNRDAFDTYIETQLAPTLNEGEVVILDNHRPHKSDRAAECLKDIKAWFLFLPSYSPDLNPIEMAFAKLSSCVPPAPERMAHSGAPSVTSATSSNETNAGTILKTQATRTNKRTML